MQQAFVALAVFPQVDEEVVPVANEPLVETPFDAEDMLTSI